MKYIIYDHQLDTNMFDNTIFNSYEEALHQLKSYHEDTISMAGDNEEAIPDDEIEEFLQVSINQL